MARECLHQEKRGSDVHGVRLVPPVLVDVQDRAAPVTSETVPARVIIPPLRADP